MTAITDEKVILSTGKSIPANNGIIGLSYDFNLSEGYDREIDNDELTIDEKKELAELMIALWEKFKDNL